MKNQKKFILIACLCTFLLFFHQLNGEAQEFDSKNDKLKYELAIDLQNFFSDGYPEKVLFKINNIKEGHIKGAYRFGLGAFYWVDKYKITQDNENYNLTAKKQKSNFSLSFGYEFQKQLDRTVFYYGADLGAYIGTTDNMDAPHAEEFHSLFFVPFAGVKFFFSTNLSVAFEAGIKNHYEWWTGEGSEGNPDNRQYHSAYIFEFQLPYSLTFNFNF